MSTNVYAVNGGPSINSINDDPAESTKKTVSKCDVT